MGGYKITKFVKIFSLKSFLLYGMRYTVNREYFMSKIFYVINFHVK